MEVTMLEVTLPESWADFLINGEDSEYTAVEFQEMRDFLKESKAVVLHCDLYAKYSDFWGFPPKRREAALVTTYYYVRRK